MTIEIKTPWGLMSLRQAAKKADILPQTLWYRYQLYQQGKYKKDQLFTPTPVGSPARMKTKDLLVELRSRGYKAEKIKEMRKK